ncbi:hypothetical protein [Arcticibacterium luteifluviistationis]|uniref:Uncharacterized protein n=1 Tax=Arcticibacterium luteifluviistationis TaxID=1784714 RepID=A0A2Z4GEI1_9BACT|nr:hypothetical protein [Arcticibacterium luteifluviistationis]AWV99656.1 hypothetical protein DJ013_16340 [Arcticibacterium luteifluviistationis]
MKIKNFEIRDFVFSENNEIDLNHSAIDADTERAMLQYLIQVVAKAFLIAMKWEFNIKKTLTINTIAYDTDTCQDNIKTQLRRGTKEPYDHFGSNVFLMSRTKFWILETDEDRLSYLADCHFKSLSNYCMHFNEDVVLLKNGYEEINKWDWFIPASNERFISTNKGIKIWIEKLHGFEKDTYRLVVENLPTLERKYYQITRKEPFMRMWLRVKSEALLKGKKELPVLEPFKFEKFKWKGDHIFSFQWGNYEKYEFDTQAEILRKHEGFVE